MDRKVINEKLEKVFKKVFQDENLTLSPSTSAREIGDWDSLKHAMLIDKVEKVFKIEFDLDDMIEMKTFGDIVNAVDRILND